MGDSPKTVILLGAGASRASDFGLPTLQGFFGDSIAALPRNVRAFLDWFYPSVPSDRYNLEEVLSFLYLAETRLSRWTLDERPPYASVPVRYRDLLPLVEERLKTPNDRLCTKHSELFKRVTPDDTIITLNYDTVAARALVALEPLEYERPPWNYRVGKLATLISEAGIHSEGTLSLSDKEQEHGFFLQLHGSLDWLHCSNVGCSHFSLILTPMLSRWPGERGVPCNLCGCPIETLIVPPISCKAVETISRLALLWSLAFRELKSARRVIVVGLSFSPADFEFRWLIRQSSEFRESPIELHLVNPSKIDRATARNLFGPLAHLVEYETLDEYLTRIPLLTVPSVPG